MRNKKVFLFVFAIIFALSINTVYAADKAPEHVIEMARTQLVKLGTDPMIVDAVQQENAKGKTLDQIKAIDEIWEKGDESDPSIQNVLKSKYAEHLKKLMESIPALENAEEIYILDNQGAIAATVMMEEQYWFGEEKGFAQAMTGELFVSDFEIDEDAGEYMVHVMVPVNNGNKTIGVVDVGLEVED